jgi:hypothetical protein
MKKTNKKKNSCAITNLWASVEAMSKDLFIDLDKQEITRLSTGNKLTPFLRGSSKKREQKYYAVKYSKNSKGYTLLLHRLFFYWHHGYLPKLVDHKDTNPQNNKIENLRELTKSSNNRNSNKDQNRKRKPSSKHKGVSKTRSNKWCARVRDLILKKDIYIGTFDNEDNAGQAYNNKLRQLGLEEVSVMNDTPQERARKNIQFDPLPPEMNHIKDLFKNLEPLVDFK